ncbi:lipopolysaccharide ABC transporter permease LptF [Limnobaculum zhutongyuii]|uniref:Lipopolysaccharide export system permease protein LptF n=1 Tax=Limnobaculum zhutongyuii TaxID=2498113 RepID=A0A411WN05_9GAMM|nr:LPS export ABC transporter permease LptF [Limnobaculum zhutongyuii]QBH97526.1 lipopolysaccharide ABC transporter permease LptF [Limnobaculum zhutongyuii]TQS91001.1 lipopolysaccharide ABC transporter permease LptF [Limnobaculum zhutongyuii]
MIIIRYLIRETFKSQIAILFILLLIFFCQKLVRVLSMAVEGDIPTNLIFSLLGLGIPEMAQLILPLSLFLGILMTFSKLYSESEITVMHACGLSKNVLLIAALALSILTGAAAGINSAWLGPLSAESQERIIADAKANPSLGALVEGQFQPSQDGNAVLFVGKVEGNQFTDVFLAQLRPSGNQRPSVVVADKGHIVEDPSGNQRIFLDTGTRYEGTALLRDFRITDFTHYQAVIGHQEAMFDDSDVEQASMSSLIASDSHQAKAELNWRLTLIISVPLMALLVVPLSEVNPRQGRVVSMLPAMLLYLIYFLLQSSLKSNASRGKIDPMIWVWVVNLGYLALGILLNLWDSIPSRRLRARLRGAV